MKAVDEEEEGHNDGMEPQRPQEEGWQNSRKAAAMTRLPMRYFIAAGFQNMCCTIGDKRGCRMYQCTAV